MNGLLTDLGTVLRKAGGRLPARRPRHLRPGRRRRWLRWTVPVVVVALLGVGGLAAYAASVPLPAEPVAVQASVLYYRDGKTILARVGVADRTDVRLDQVPLAIRRAVLAAEDRGYSDHWGVSTRGVLRAIWANLFEGASEGASTITQQYARNAYLTQDVTAERKVKEIILAGKLERRFTKDEILERYLNTVYFGRGAHGIQAAATAYFGVPVERLTLHQGAVLASLIKDPWGFDPAVDKTAAQDRWRWILTSMESLGWAEKGAAGAAYPTVAEQSPSSQALKGPLGLVVDLVESELAAKGISHQTLRTAGLHVVTTIDATAQQAATDKVTAALRELPFGLRAALVAQDPSSGGIVAYYGGDQGSGYFDDAQAPRPPASAFKPLVLAEALNQGISYESRWNGSSPREFKDRHGVPLHNRLNVQCPDCPLTEAMIKSLNTPFYAVAERVGPENVRNLAYRLGVPTTYGGAASLVDEQGAPTPGRTRADIALGRYPVAPVDLAGVYATFAAGGTRAQRHFVTSVKDPQGGTVYTASPKKTRAVDEAVAADVTAVLSEVVTADGGVPERSAAGKTGTQQYGNAGDQTQDAWMAGYTRQLAAVVWIGRGTPGPVTDMGGKPINGDGLPMDLWRDFLGAALRDQPNLPFPEPAHIGRIEIGDATTVLPSTQPLLPSGPGRETGEETGSRRREAPTNPTDGQRPPSPDAAVKPTAR